MRRSDHPRPVRLRFAAPQRSGTAAMERVNKLAEAGRFDGALKLTEELLADDAEDGERFSPVDPWALRELASNVYTALDRHADARPLLEQMLVIAQRHSADDAELHARSRYLLAACIIRLAEAAEEDTQPPSAEPGGTTSSGYSGTVMQHATLRKKPSSHLSFN